MHGSIILPRFEQETSPKLSRRHPLQGKSLLRNDGYLPVRDNTSGEMRNTIVADAPLAFRGASILADEDEFNTQQLNAQFAAIVEPLSPSYRLSRRRSGAVEMDSVVAGLAAGAAGAVDGNVPLIHRENSSQSSSTTHTRFSSDHGKLFSDSRGFQMAVTGLIFLNTVFIAVQVALIQHKELRLILERIDVGFTFVYCVEICLRLQDYRLQFFRSEDCNRDLWNIFDFMVTGISAVDSLMVLLGDRSSDDGEEVCRLFRILRILRMFRAVRFLGDVEYVIIMAAKAMLKLCFLVSLVIFVAAVVSTHLLYDSNDEAVFMAFGDLGRSMWSLLKIMTLGESGAMDRVVDAHPSMVVFFVLFIFCASIALVSLVPAIFIALNLEARSKEQRKEQIQKAQDDVARKLRIVEQVFELARTEGGPYNNGVTWKEMAKALDSDMVRELYRDLSVSEFQEIVCSVASAFAELRSEPQNHCQDPDSLRILRPQLLRGVTAAQQVSVAQIWESVCAQRHAMGEVLATLRKQEERLNLTSSDCRLYALWPPSLTQCGLGSSLTVKRKPSKRHSGQQSGTSSTPPVSGSRSATFPASPGNTPHHSCPTWSPGMSSPVPVGSAQRQRHTTGDTAQRSPDVVLTLPGTLKRPVPFTPVLSPLVPSPSASDHAREVAEQLSQTPRPTAQFGPFGNLPEEPLPPPPVVVHVPPLPPPPLSDRPVQPPVLLHRPMTPPAASAPATASGVTTMASWPPSWEVPLRSPQPIVSAAAEMQQPVHNCGVPLPSAFQRLVDSSVGITSPRNTDRGAEPTQSMNLPLAATSSSLCTSPPLAVPNPSTTTTQAGTTSSSSSSAVLPTELTFAQEAAMALPPPVVAASPSGDRPGRGALAEVSPDAARPAVKLEDGTSRRPEGPTTIQTLQGSASLARLQIGGESTGERPTGTDCKPSSSSGS